LFIYTSGTVEMGRTLFTKVEKGGHFFAYNGGDGQKLFVYNSGEEGNLFAYNSGEG
jgi:hypothetical protein